jgi:hypothetical protein
MGLSSALACEGERVFMHLLIHVHICISPELVRLITRLERHCAHCTKRVLMAKVDWRQDFKACQLCSVHAHLSRIRSSVQMSITRPLIVLHLREYVILQAYMCRLSNSAPVRLQISKNHKKQIWYRPQPQPYMCPTTSMFIHVLLLAFVHVSYMHVHSMIHKYPGYQNYACRLANPMSVKLIMRWT